MQVPNAAGRAAVTEMYDLRKKADQACERGRYARAEELFQRALAVAEAAVPPDSLLIVIAILQLQATLLHADSVGWTGLQKLMHMQHAHAERLAERCPPPTAGAPLPARAGCALACGHALPADSS
jgi:hypothetical protein